MAARGDVLVLKRRAGFGASHSTERFIVVQADTLNDVLETTVVVPLDAAFAFYTDYPGAVRIAARHVGTSRDQVAVLTAVASLDLTRFESGPVARVDAETVAEIDRTLAAVLGFI